MRLDLTKTRIEVINAVYGTTVLDSSADLPGVYLLRLAPGGDAPGLVRRMLNDRRVLYAELDAVSKSPIAYPRSISGWAESNSTVADPRSISGWSGQDPAPYLQQPVANRLGILRAQGITRGAGITVAVLDTGVQLDHPMLAVSYTDARYDFVDNDPDPTDVANAADDDGDGLIDEAYGHGTHVSGIVHLVAPDAKIMPVRVLEADGSGYVFTLAKAIAWAAHHGAQVINLSLGTNQASLVLHDAVSDAHKLGVVIVAAAGNTDWLMQQYPAADADAAAITSVSDAGLKSSFANYGFWIDLAAPGEGIISTYPGNGYAVWSGTSFAVPFAAGQAALIRSLAPGWGVADVVNAMRQSAIPLRTTDRQYGELLGAGLIDVGASVDWVRANPTPATKQKAG